MTLPDGTHRLAVFTRGGKDGAAREAAIASVARAAWAVGPGRWARTPPPDRAEARRMAGPVRSDREAYGAALLTL